MFALKPPRGTRWEAWYARTGKDCLDRISAAVLLVGLTPLLAAVAVVVRIGLGPGVLYRQPRAGQGARPFVCLKFRTLPWQAPGTPRPQPARLGWVLRHTCLDELPQLVNVLRGEMSFVGPRPELLDAAANYDAHERQRFAAKPGLTGFWQITLRNKGDALRPFAALDIDYVRNLTPLNDLRILWRTPGAIWRLPAASESAAAPRPGSTTPPGEPRASA